MKEKSLLYTVCFLLVVTLLFLVNLISSNFIPPNDQLAQVASVCPGTLIIDNPESDAFLSYSGWGHITADVYVCFRDNAGNVSKVTLSENHDPLLRHDTLGGQVVDLWMPIYSEYNPSTGKLSFIVQWLKEKKFVHLEFLTDGGSLPKNVLSGGITDIATYVDALTGKAAKLKSGAIVLSWGNRDPANSQNTPFSVAYLSPSTNLWKVTGPISHNGLSFNWQTFFSPAVQHPADNSVWFFATYDSRGVIGALHYTELADQLRYDWANTQWIPQYENGGGLLSSDEEWPNVTAQADPHRNTIIVAYESGQKLEYINSMIGMGGPKWTFATVATVGPNNEPRLLGTFPYYISNAQKMDIVPKPDKIYFEFQAVDDSGDVPLFRSYYTVYSGPGQFNVGNSLSLPKLLNPNVPLGTTAQATEITPPSVSINSPITNQTLSGIVKLSSSASDSSGVEAVQYYMDGYPIYIEVPGPNYVRSWDTKNVPNGTHSITAVARDTSGNTQTSAPVTVIINNANNGEAVALTKGVDTAGSITAPNSQGWDHFYVDVPVGSSKLEVTLKFPLNQYSQIDKNTRLFVGQTPINMWHSYECYPLARSLVTSFKCTISYPSAGRWWVGINNTRDGTSTYTVNMTLDGGVVFGIDAVNPTGSISAPLNNATISGKYTVIGTALDDKQLATVTLYRDGATVVGTSPLSAGLSSTWSLPFDTTTLANGAHTLVAEVKDATGNIGRSSTVTVNVNNTTTTTSPPPSTTPPPPTSGDTTPPLITMTSPMNGLTVKTKASVALQAQASDNVGVTRVQFFVNNTLVCSDALAPYSCSWTVPSKRKTTYSINAKAFDAAGNSRTSATVRVSVP